MNKKLSIIIIVVILLAGAIYFVFFNKNSPQSAQVSSSINEYPSVSNNIENTYTLTPSVENSDNNVYSDLQYNFSFQYPKDFTATKFQEGESGNTILVQYREQSNIANDSSQVSTSINKYPENVSFQIFISPFDEPGPLTKERILQDLPDLIIKNPEQRVLKNGAVALIFFSQEPSIGEIREIWFVYNGYLYQISTYKELDSLVADILETWRFQ